MGLDSIKRIINTFQGKEIELPMFQMGINRFDRGRRITEPHDEYLWNLEGAAWDGTPVHGGVWDRQTGRTVPGSIQLTAKDKRGAQVLVFFGPSYFMGDFTAPVYEISCWIKAREHSRGSASVVVDDLMTKEKQSVSLSLDETDGWSRVCIYSDIIHRAAICRLYFRFEGEGRVWFDDLCIRPLYKR